VFLGFLKQLNIIEKNSNVNEIKTDHEQQITSLYILITLSLSRLTHQTASHVNHPEIAQQSKKKIVQGEFSKAHIDKLS
jgi:hypothetical protein